MVDRRIRLNRSRIPPLFVLVHHHEVEPPRSDHPDVVVANHSRLDAIPRGPGRHLVGCSVEMVVPEGDRLDPRISIRPLSELANALDVPLVQDLVALEIERPCPRGVEEADHLLLPVDEAATGTSVPLGIDDSDPFVADGFDRLARPVGALAEGDFIDNVILFELC